MTLHGFKSLLAGIALALGTFACPAAETKAESAAAPDFKEVYESLRAHLAGVSEAELNRAAVVGMVSALGPKVSLVTSGESASGATQTPLLGKTYVVDGDIAYVGVERVGDGLASAVHDALERLTATNKLVGVVLDLRYAGGVDYAAVAAVAELFTRTERPLLNWGDGMVKAKEKSDSISVPVAVLVNRQTAAAAEGLAAVLREIGVGLILGGRTAGQAVIAQEFPLKNGDRLRIATGFVKLGDGSSLPTEGLKPDILVEVNPDDERAYHADAFKLLGKGEGTVGGGVTATNQANSAARSGRRLRFNEAELVRERKEGVSEADLSAMREREPDKPTVYDPALARALDLLKGLALVRQSRS